MRCVRTEEGFLGIARFVVAINGLESVTVEKYLAITHERILVRLRNRSYCVRRYGNMCAGGAMS